MHLGEDDGEHRGRARDRSARTALIGVSCYDDFDARASAVARGRRLRRVRQLLPVADEARRAPRRASIAARARARARRAGRRDRRHHADNARALIDAGADAVAVDPRVFGTTIRPTSRARRAPSPHASRRFAPHGCDIETWPPMSRNDELFARAQRTIPAGVNSPVRAFRSVGGTPRFFARGEGAYLWDADGKRYIDYVGSWGPAILGHAHPGGRARGAGGGARTGLSFGAPTEIEIELAETLCGRCRRSSWCAWCRPAPRRRCPRCASRAATPAAAKIVKFEGCYHGHGDSLLVKAGSGALTFGQPSSAGVPPAIADDTIVLPYNDLAAVEAAFTRRRRRDRRHHRRAGRRQHEPDRCRAPGFLEGCARLCDRHGAVLIFDEVMTGFRVHPQRRAGAATASRPT